MNEEGAECTVWLFSNKISKLFQKRNHFFPAKPFAKYFTMKRIVFYIFIRKEFHIWAPDWTLISLSIAGCSNIWLIVFLQFHNGFHSQQQGWCFRIEHKVILWQVSYSFLSFVSVFLSLNSFYWQNLNRGYALLLANLHHCWIN